MSSMTALHQILLEPTDVLFFRDGRPMSGASAGHTAAWPLPDVVNHALHAALHRAGFQDAHAHRRGRSGDYSNDRTRKFGCLTTAGPFPVRLLKSNAGSDARFDWFLPRPKDTQVKKSVKTTLKPLKSLTPDTDGIWRESSLPKPLRYAVVNVMPPSKDTGGEPWISSETYQRYLAGSDSECDPTNFLKDDDIADTECTIGISIDPATGTAGQGESKGQIYSAHYLRLRADFRLGLFAQALDKVASDPDSRRDLVRALLNDAPQSIVVGGQQRLCTARRSDAPVPLPLPTGLANGFNVAVIDGQKRRLVKWVLITPAIWPEIEPGISKRGTERKFHPGGWLPNWVCPETGRVLLETVNQKERQNRRSLNALGKGYQSNPNIGAWLVAAIVPKPIIVTGWALPNGTDRPVGGAKSTHLAVPAGAVYYFEAESADAAAALAAALNWHGNTRGTEIRNRRSTLLGEKGYGLGVCGTWEFHEIGNKR